MDDFFEIDIHFKGREMGLVSELLLQGHTHKIKVAVDGVDLFFEPDEEGHYRAVAMPWQDAGSLSKIDRALLSAIGQRIEEILA